MANIANGVLEIWANAGCVEILEVVASDIRSATPFSYACPPSIEIKQDNDNAVLVVGFTCAWTGEQCWDWLDEQMGEESSLPLEARDLLVASSICGRVSESGMDWNEEVSKDNGSGIVNRSTSGSEPIEITPQNRLIVAVDNTLTIPADLLNAFCSEGDLYEWRVSYSGGWIYGERQSRDLHDIDSVWHSSYDRAVGLTLGKELLACRDYQSGDVFKAWGSADELTLRWVGEFANDNRLPEEWRILDLEETALKIREGLVDQDILRILVRSKDDDVRLAIAHNALTPDDVIEELRDDPCSEVVQAVNERSLLPAEWRFLDSDQRIKKLRSDKGTTGIEVLQVLATSCDPEVRQEIASMPGTPNTVLQSLLDDSNSSVSGAALETLLPHEWKGLRIKDIAERLSIPGFSDLTILRLLAKSQEYEIRIAVARCPLTPDDVRAFLLDDSDDEVMWAALSRDFPSTWKDLRLEWEHIDEDDDYDDVFDSLNRKARKEGSVDGSVLLALSKAPHSSLRKFVSMYEHTPQSILECLADDSDERISEVAGKRINKLR